MVIHSDIIIIVSKDAWVGRNAPLEFAITDVKRFTVGSHDVPVLPHCIREALCRR